MANSPKPEVATARQLFLYGAGDGKRIVGTQALVEATGVHEQTIRKHLPKWLKEAEELLSNTSELGVSLSLSAIEIESHQADMSHLRQDIDSIKFEMNSLDDVIEKLAGICEKFSLNTENGDAALKIFDSYLRASLNKSHLRGQFLSAEKRWIELSNISALKDITVTKEKTLAVGRAKIKLKGEESEASAPTPVARGGVFARPAIDTETVVED